MRFASFTSRYRRIADSRSASIAAFWAIDNPNTLADPEDFAGAFRVARRRVGGATAMSFKRVLTGGGSNSVFLALGPPDLCGPVEGWVSASEYFLVAGLAEDIASLSPEVFWSRFILAEDLTAARTEGLKSVSIRLAMRAVVGEEPFKTA